MPFVPGFAFGLPTPPASPVSNVDCPLPPPIAAPTPIAQTQPCLGRYIPLAPEKRLGWFLEGKLQLTGILGTGAYGVVYSAVDVTTQVQYAVKCLSKFNADGSPLDRRQVAFQQREIRLHYAASAHPNVVSMLRIVDHPDCTYVILEYCPEGDLFYNITECGQYVGKDELARSVFLQILDAVEHCHSLGIYHRDLKPENILVSNYGQTVKLADFGLATSSRQSEDYGCGSTFYMSPECLDPSTRRPFYYCAPNDVWSLGVILVNLTCGRNPWKQASVEDSTYRAYMRSQDFLKSILPLTDELNNILTRIFNPNPDHRIELAELRTLILECPRFTIPPTMMPLDIATPPASPEATLEYVSQHEDSSTYSDYASPTYADSPESLDDSDSDCSSDDGSLTSSGSTISDSDEEFFQERKEQMEDMSKDYPSPPVFEDPEDINMSYASQEEYVAQHYTGPVPIQHIQVPVAVPDPSAALHQMPMTVQVPTPVHVPSQPISCVSKSFLAFLPGMAKLVPALQPPIPFEHQVPFFAATHAF